MSEDIESVMSQVPLVEVSCQDDGGGEDVRIHNVRSSRSSLPCVCCVPLLDLVTNIPLSPNSMAEGLSLPDFAAQLALQGARE